MAKGSTKIDKMTLGMLDSRVTDDDTGLLIQRDRKVEMIDIFKTEQKTAVAYFVSDLMAKGYNNRQIIDSIKLKYNLDWSLAMVSRVQKLLHKMWRCDIAHTMNDQIAREVATIDVQIKEAWEAWEFSKKGIKHTKTRNANQDSPADEMKFNLAEVTVDEDTCAGDVKFQNLILELGKEKRKLLGLYSPEKKQDTSNVPQAVQFNIVGSGKEGEAADLMKTIMGMSMPDFGPKPKQEPIQEAEVVETANPDEDFDIDEMMNEIMV